VTNDDCIEPDMRTGVLNLLRSRRFGTFWFACLLSNIGTWAQQVAEPWLIGASSIWVGLDSFATDRLVAALDDRAAIPGCRRH